jgi:carboxyl-terminal processing protease
MNRRVVYSVLIALLGVNLFFGAQIFLYSASASPKDDPYENYKLLADVLEKVRQEHVDGAKLTYQELIRGALKGMLNSLDPHSEFMDAAKFDELKEDTQGEFGGLGIVVQMSKDKYLTVVAPMEDTPGFKAGILPLDRILKIDGHNAERLSQDEAIKHLRGAPGTEVTITILRPSSGEIKDIKLVRAAIKVDTAKDINGKREFPIGENGIGYVRLTQFGERTSAELDAALEKLQKQNMRALVLDLRGNPGGLLEQAELVCEHFVNPRQLIVSTEGRNPAQSSVYKSSGKTKKLDMPVAVLVNLGSASASEIVAGCLQDLQAQTRAIIIGEQTFGKGSVQSILPLPDGSALRLTTAKYYTPSHKVIHEHGITPDIEVKMSEADESDLFYRRRTPGALDTLDSKERERVEAIQDVQLECAYDVLKGVLIYSQRAVKPAEKVAAK